jgi:hypothetical protein
MSAVILFEFPSARAEARSWLLDHAAKLALEGSAELKFIGNEEAGTETIALELENLERAYWTLSQWRRDAAFPRLVETRLLKTERVSLAGAVFP